MDLSDILVIVGGLGILSFIYSKIHKKTSLPKPIPKPPEMVTPKVEEVIRETQEVFQRKTPLQMIQAYNKSQERRDEKAADSNHSSNPTDPMF